jgi:penicillin-binding protein 1A
MPNGFHAPRARHRGLLVAVLATCIVASSCGAAREAPPLAIPTNAEPSVILDAQGRQITVLRDENRTNVPLDQIPAVLQNAVVAIEDARFWSHDGIDPRGIARAASSNAAAGEVAQGGSTITQQYVKTALLTPERTLGRKVEEATLAVALERNYSKELILELYLNTIYFGDGSYGVDSAARNYFGVEAKDLTLDQAALLAGIIRAPSRYDPRSAPDTARSRRDVVLARMQELGYITRDQRLAASAAPVEVVPPLPTPEQLPYPAAHFVDEAKDWLLKRSDALGTSQAQRYDALVRGGLRITTTIDLDLQAQAEESIAAVLRNQGSDPRTPDAGLVAVDPRTGFVRAMVGGYDYFGSHDYRQANLARGKGRQTGSAFKPIVLAAALANGVSAERRFDAPSTQVHRIPGGGSWTVSGGGIGAGTMGQCTVVSSNTCYANIILDPAVGPERTVDMAKRLGVTSSLQANPAAVLGTNDATVLDMASVYATFANGGVHVPPVFVTRIERSDGTVLYEHQHTQSKALEPEVARQVSEILPGVITSGTGTAAAIDRPAGGKTGSSQNNVDAWFCGYTPQLATAVWVGFSQPRPDRNGRLRPVPMTRPNARITVFGGTYPAQIWANFMRRALAGQPALPLSDPAAIPPATTTVPPSDQAQLRPVELSGRATMPDVSGLDRRTAIERIRSAGLTAEEVEGPPGSAPPGRVAAQSPAPGTGLPAGSKVYIEISPGTVVPTEPVPDVRGFGAGQARTTLEGLGFTVTTENVTPPPGTLRPDGEGYVAGQVWRSSPGGGARSPDGKVVISVMPLTPTSAPPATPSTTAPRD